MIYIYSPECTSDLGMRNQKIINGMLSASSERDSSHLAKNARLFSHRAWCSARSEYEKYVEVNFGLSAKEITAFATQGHPTEYKWMNKYELRYALGSRWFKYQVNGKVKVSGLLINTALSETSFYLPSLTNTIDEDW